MGRHAFADVALIDPADFVTVRRLFQGSRLICMQVSDMHGGSWYVILKNVYAIVFGVSDELKLGDNMRGHLMVTALAELSAIGKYFGAETATPYSYAGLGDLTSTATSENSHHHELGRKLASGQCVKENITGEGIHTLKMIEKYQLFNRQEYPLFQLVNDIVCAPDELVKRLETYFEQLKTW